MSTFSPQSPPTPAMFALDQPMLFQPQPDWADWSMELDVTADAAGAGLGHLVQALDDIQQCLLILLTTPKGSDPFRPTFGADLFRWIDAPIDIATANLAREAAVAIQTWERRAVFESLSVAPIDATDQSGSHLQLTVSWRPSTGGELQILSFAIGGN